VGAILQSSRLQGILQGTAAGEVMLRYVMSDEKVAPGEQVLTSGGDRIFPKGLPVGTVQQTNPGSDLFLNIRIKPAADLSRLEEVLVVSKVVENTPSTSQASAPVRAADILAERLPSVPPKPPAVPAKEAGRTSTTATKPSAATTPSNGVTGASSTGTRPSTPAAVQSQASAGAATPGEATPDNAAKKPAAKPAGTAPGGGAVGVASGAGIRPAVVKPAASKAAASGDAAKPKAIDSAEQPAKPAAPSPQPSPGEEVQR